MILNILLESGEQCWIDIDANDAAELVVKNWSDNIYETWQT